MKLTKFEIVVLLIILSLGALFLLQKEDTKNYDLKNKYYKEFSSKTDKNEEKENSFENGTIEVHITGRIKNPGVYKIENGTRLDDLIKLAGGTMEDANIESLNLARKLKDEEKVVIKSVLDNENEEHLININKASKETLKNISGVGEKMADKIIKYRQEHPFSTIEELMNIPGLGKKKFEEIKLYITVD